MRLLLINVASLQRSSMPPQSPPGNALPPDTDASALVLAICWVFLGLAIVIVAMRFYARGILTGMLSWDDYTILLSLVICSRLQSGMANTDVQTLGVSQGIFQILSCAAGFGRNVQFLQSTEIERVLLYIAIAELTHTFGTYLVRISVCLFVLRLVPNHEKRFRWWIYALMAFFTVVTMIALFFLCFQCIPFQGLWNQKIKARCIARDKLSIVEQTQGSLSVLTDLLCACLPIFFLRQLQTSRRTKVALFVILGLGFL